MNLEHDYQNICKSIKEVIRRNGMTYGALSKKIKVPVSTLKKQLNADDGSFNKLVRICKGLDINIGDLIHMELNEPVKDIKFSTAQQRALSADRDLFSFYWRMVFERKKLKTIKRMMKLSESEVKQYLLRLDKVGLIVLNQDDQIGLPDIGYVQWRPVDSFTRSLFKEWSMQLILDGMAQADKNQFLLQHFRLTSQSREELQSRLLELEEEFARRTVQELKLFPAKVSSVRSLFVNCVGSFVSDSAKL